MTGLLVTAHVIKPDKTCRLRKRENEAKTTTWLQTRTSNEPLAAGQLKREPTELGISSPMLSQCLLGVMSMGQIQLPRDQPKPVMLQHYQYVKILY